MANDKKLIQTSLLFPSRLMNGPRLARSPLISPRLALIAWWKLLKEREERRALVSIVRYSFSALSRRPVEIFPRAEKGREQLIRKSVQTGICITASVVQCFSKFFGFFVCKFRVDVVGFALSVLFSWLVFLVLVNCGQCIMSLVRCKIKLFLCHQ